MDTINLLTLCMLKLAMGTYSGQKPRLGIWALAQARPESTRMIFPNMSDDDLPRTSDDAPTFIYNKQERWPNGLIPSVLPRVSTLTVLSRWPDIIPAVQTMVIGQSCAYESLGKLIDGATKNQKCKIHYATSGWTVLPDWRTPAPSGTPAQRGLPTLWNANATSRIKCAANGLKEF